jgi:hypothetical protein
LAELLGLELDLDRVFSKNDDNRAIFEVQASFDGELDEPPSEKQSEFSEIFEACESRPTRRR